MPKIARVTIWLSEEFLRRIDITRHASGGTRGAFFRRAAEEYLRREREAEAQYVRAYRENPETAEEMGWVEATFRGVLGEYPWNDVAEG